MSNPFDFSRALTIIKGGGVVTRQCWESTGITIGVVVPEPSDGRPNMMSPFLALRAPSGHLMAWAPSSQEMFAIDWVEIEMGVFGHG